MRSLLPRLETVFSCLLVTKDAELNHWPIGGIRRCGRTEAVPEDKQGTHANSCKSLQIAE